MKIYKLRAGDSVELKKPHPCGSKLFRIIRAGSDVRFICCGCGRDMTLERIAFERAIKKHISSTAGEDDEK
jgi:hypothetical protein